MWMYLGGMEKNMETANLGFRNLGFGGLRSKALGFEG